MINFIVVIEAYIVFSLGMIIPKRSLIGPLEAHLKLSTNKLPARKQNHRGYQEHWYEHTHQALPHNNQRNPYHPPRANSVGRSGGHMVLSDKRPYHYPSGCGHSGHYNALGGGDGYPLEHPYGADSKSLFSFKLE